MFIIFIISMDTEILIHLTLPSLPAILSNHAQLKQGIKMAQEEPVRLPEAQLRLRKQQLPGACSSYDGELKDQKPSQTMQTHSKPLPGCCTTPNPGLLPNCAHMCSVAQSCLTLCDPHGLQPGYSLSTGSDSSVHGILQARKLRHREVKQYSLDHTAVLCALSHSVVSDSL